MAQTEIVWNEGVQPGDRTYVFPVNLGSATVEMLPADSPPSVSVSGTSTDVAFAFRLPKGDTGDQGIPGPTAIPADTAVASYVGSESSTRSALDARYPQLHHAAQHGFGGADPVSVDERQLVSPVRDWVREAMRKNLSESIDGGFRMVLLGDSHTNDGALELSPTGAEIWGGGKGYSYRLANLLVQNGPGECQAGVAVSKPTAVGKYVWEAATGGNTSGNYCPAGTLANIQTLQPHLVVHMIGTNDHATQVPTATVLANIRAAIDGIWSRVPNARQLFIIPWPRKNPPGASYSWVDLAIALRTLTTAYASDARFALLDYGARFQRLGSPFYPADLWGIMPDDIHGDGNLHRDLAERLAEWMGLPSPAVTFANLRPLHAPAFTAGALGTTPAATITIPALPVPREGRATGRVLAAVGIPESDLIIDVTVAGQATKSYPHHVTQSGPTTFMLEAPVAIPAHKACTVSLRAAASSGINIYAGGWYDQYNHLLVGLEAV